MLTLKLFLVLAVGMAASPKKVQRTPNQDQLDPSCSSGVIGKEFKIEFGKPLAEDKPALLVTKSDGTQFPPWALPALDPSVACRKMLYFPEQNILIVEMYEGQNGTVVVNKSRSLFVYRIGISGITFLALYPLEQTAQKDDQPIRYFVQSNYEAKVLNKRVELSIRNELSPLKETSKHTY
jgi:hypothetical protein